MLADVRRYRDVLARLKVDFSTLLATFLLLQGNELADVRRHHNDALARVKEQSEALLNALSQQKARGEADEDAVEQVGVFVAAV